MKTRWYLPIVLVGAHWGCDGTADGGDGTVEDLTIVVEADKSRILQEEEELQRRRATVQEEQERLAKERAEVSERLSNLSKKDRKQREELEAEQQRLGDEERRIRSSSKRFEDERQKLADEKNQLIERISRMTQTKGGLTIAQREEMIAAREKQVAAREADVARRERELGKREAESGRHLQQVRSLVDELKQGAGKTVVVHAAAPSPGAAPATRSQALRVKKQVESKMDSKGILSADLGGNSKDAMRQAEAALKGKDYSSAVDLFAQVESVLDSTQINRDFVKGKFDRLNREFPSSGQDSRVQALLNEASMYFTDGRWARANKKINQIIATLEKK